MFSIISIIKNRNRNKVNRGTSVEKPLTDDTPEFIICICIIAIGTINMSIYCIEN
jgi:hypothetical protein